MSVNYVHLPHLTPESTPPDPFDLACAQAARRFHSSIPEYAPTPLVSLPSLAAKTGVASIHVKDESYRFGLDAFKVLGGSYSIARKLGELLDIPAEDLSYELLTSREIHDKTGTLTFVTATDGNHGRGVAWAARQLGCRAHVYLPAGSVPARAQAILDAGAAQAEILPLSYDETVQYAARMAEAHGWQLIQDTSWPGYEAVPTWIIQGYTTMAREAADQLAQAGHPRPTHIFLQAGVGAMAGGVLGCLAARYGDQAPVFVSVEPEDIPCIYRSALAGDGQPHTVAGEAGTIMAGLNCGTPCSLTWPVLRDGVTWYFACPDAVAEAGMRRLGRPLPGDQAVVSGESGAVTAGLLDWLTTRPDLADLRQRMGLDGESVILLFSTEGDTDPDHYRQVLCD